MISDPLGQDFMVGVIEPPPHKGHRRKLTESDMTDMSDFVRLSDLSDMSDLSDFSDFFNAI